MHKTLMMLAIVGGALALGACASQPPAGQTSQKTAQNPQQTTAQDQQTHRVCFHGAALGSHIVQSKCVVMTTEQYKSYQEQKKKQAEEDKSALGKAQNNRYSKECGGTTGIAC